MFANFLSSIGPSALAQGGMMGAQDLTQQPKQGGGFFNAIGKALGIGGGDDDGAPKQPQRYGDGSFWDTVGRISDAIGTVRGAPQTYSPMMQQQDKFRQEQEKREGRNALGEWLANPEDMSKWLIGAKADPETALGMRKTMAEINAPAKRDTVEIDGVVFDKNTGQPLFESPYNRIIAGPDGEFLEQPRIGIGRGGVAPAQPSMSADDAAPILRNASQSKVISPEDAERVRSSLGNNGGQRAYDAWLQRNGISIGRQMGGKTYYQVNGRWYDNPEGR